MKSKTKLLISSALTLSLGLLLTRAIVTKKFPTEDKVSHRTPICEVITSIDC